GVRELAAKGIFPGGTRANLEYYGKRVSWGSQVEETQRIILADAQTSGGLLIAIAGNRVDPLLSALARRRVAVRAHIGEIFAGETGRIQVV
ncbi:MAG: selenide, water dikinase SelD, partial [Vicinamibacteria bacterium]